MVIQYSIIAIECILHGLFWALHLIGLSYHHQLSLFFPVNIQVKKIIDEKRSCLFIYPISRSFIFSCWLQNNISCNSYESGLIISIIHIIQTWDLISDFKFKILNKQLGNWFYLINWYWKETWRPKANPSAVLVLKGCAEMKNKQYFFHL